MEAGFAAPALPVAVVGFFRVFVFRPVPILEGNFKPETAFKLPSSFEEAKGFLYPGLAVFANAYFSSSSILAVSFNKDFAPTGLNEAGSYYFFSSGIFLASFIKDLPPPITLFFAAGC